MAKVREASDGLNVNQSNRKGDGLTGTNRKIEDKIEEAATPSSSRSLMSRIGGFLAPPPRAANSAQQDARATRPQSSWGKLLFGFMVYLLGSFILQPLILLIFGWLHINPAARQTLFPANTWIIGTANAYTIVYFVFLAVFIWALFRFNIIPRDPFGARANAQRRATGASGSPGTPGASGGSMTTPPPASSALRHAGRRRLPMTDGTSQPRPTRSFRSFLWPRAASTQTTSATAKPAAKPIAKPAAMSSAKVATSGPTRTAARSTASNGNAAKGTVATSNHDAHYERVKSSQRSRRRKR